MNSSFLVLFPPFLVLFLAFYTKRILESLVIGIITAALMATDFNFLKTLELIKLVFIEKITDTGNLYLFAFLIFLGVTLATITKTGGAIALGKLLTKKLRDRRSTETTSIILSSLLAIDDYLNCLTSGFVMRPIADAFKIARIKLSFLVNSMAVPAAILIPFSTWASMILKQLYEAGISIDCNKQALFKANPLVIYLEIIPFIFYSIIMIFGVWFIVRARISYGTIKEHELIAQESGDLFGGKKSNIKAEEIDETNISLIDFAAPMAVLIIGFAIGILYTGKASIFGGSNTIFEACQNANIFAVLFYVGFATMLTAFGTAIYRKKINFNDVLGLSKEGFNLTFSAIMLIFLAWNFSAILVKLEVGQYLAGILINNVNEQLLPLLVFIASATVSLIIGSSWGTISLMLPIATQIVYQFSNPIGAIDGTITCYLIPTLGAVLSGAIAGNHMSPIADVSVMSAISCGANHLEHVKGQFYYALPVFLATAISYAVSGFVVCESKLLGLILPLSIGIAISWGLFFTFSKLSKRI